MGVRDAERSGGGRSLGEKRSHLRVARSPYHRLQRLQTTRELTGQDVFEPLFLAVIAAQCRNHSQCWPVALSLELNRCHERFHFPARHKLTEYVMDPIHPDDLFVVPIYDMGIHLFECNQRLTCCDSLPSCPKTPFTESPQVSRGPEGARRKPSP
jgi:hypothetical protein